MTTRITNTVLLRELIEKLGNRGLARFEIGADVSHSTAMNMLRGSVPSDSTRKRVAAFFQRDEDELFPLTKMEGEAA